MGKPSDRDVVIVGAGIFGLACAWACTQAGLSVLVVEKDRPGAGASGGLVGALSPHLPDAWNEKKQFQLESLLAAEAFWADIRQAGGTDPGYRRCGRLLPLLTEGGRNAALARADQAVTNWPGEFSWQVLDQAALPDWLAADAAPFGAVQETLSARLNPQRAVEAMTAALLAQGCRIRTGQPVSSVETGQVVAGGERLRAGAVVLAAGTGDTGLLQGNLASPQVRGVKGQAALLSGGRAPAGRMLYGGGVYVVPHADGTVAVGSTSENDWDHPHTVDSALEALIAKARLICPPLASAKVLARKAGVRPRAPKPDPVIGELPGLPGVFIANGGFKIGFGLAPRIGEEVARLVSGRQTSFPDRFLPQAHGFTEAPTETD